MTKRKPLALTPAELETVGRWTSADWERLAKESEGRPVPSKDAPQARPDGSAGIPPTVKRGEHEEVAVRERVELVLADGKVKLVERRTGLNGKVGFIDWLNITFHEETAHQCGWGVQIPDTDVVRVISAKLQELVGFGITRQCENGRNFYKRSYELGDGLGYVCHGGQRNTVLVMLNGQGLMAAADGWERRLHHFLTEVAIQPRITRCDVAHDCFAGEYTVDQALNDYRQGAFRLAKSPTDPDCETRGNWERPNGKGRSFYVGHRTSGKFFRAYEKGKQLGAPSSEWVRVECEYKSADRVIPFDILLNPGAYLAGAYPALEWVSVEQERIVTFGRALCCDKARKERWIQRVCGPDLDVLADLEPGANPYEKAFNLIERLRDRSRDPRWSKMPDQLRGDAYMHDGLTAAADCVPVDIKRIADAFERDLNDGNDDESKGHGRKLLFGHDRRAEARLYESVH